MGTIEFQELRGPDALSHLEQIAKLRIEVFSEWPYIYDGDFEYETTYLKTYF